MGKGGKARGGGLGDSGVARILEKGGLKYKEITAHFGKILTMPT